MFGVKDKTKDIIDSVWCDQYYIVAAREDAPSKSEVKKFFKQKAVPLPKEFLTHTTNFWGSFYLEVKEDIWPRATAGDVGPFWTFLYGMFVYTFSEEAPEWMNIEVATNEFEEMGHNVIPVLKVMGDADMYCISSEGDIVRYLHEEDIFEPYDGNFFDLLVYEVNELESRRIKYNEKS